MYLTLSGKMYNLYLPFCPLFTRCLKQSVSQLDDIVFSCNNYHSRNTAAYRPALPLKQEF